MEASTHVTSHVTNLSTYQLFRAVPSTFSQNNRALNRQARPT